MSAHTARRCISRLFLVALVGLLITCTDQQPQPFEPDVVSPLFSNGGVTFTISGDILGPDGESICDQFPDGSLQVWVIDPASQPGGGTVADPAFQCPDNHYSAEIPPGIYHLRVRLPRDPDRIGFLPWNYLEPTPVEVVDGPMEKDIQVFEGLPMGGSATLDGLPTEEASLVLVYSSFTRYLSARGYSRSDGSWEDEVPGRDLMVQPDLEHVVHGTSCFSLGTRQSAPISEGPFLFAEGLDEVNCVLETSRTVAFSHHASQIVVTPMPGDVGGLSPELVDEWGQGWGVQFPVPEGESPSHGRASHSQLYRGGLMVGISPSVILTGFSSYLECGGACRDLGLDGSVTTDGDQVVWTYSDAMSPDGFGLAVEQRSVEGKEGSDYVLFQFNFTNQGSSTVTFNPGFFGDWDVDGTPYDDVGVTDLDGRLMYVTNDGLTGSHMGTVWFENRGLPGNYFLTGTSGGLSMAEQFDVLSGALAHGSEGPADVYYIHGAGPITLSPGESAERWMAVVAGEDQTQLLANVATAEVDVVERTVTVTISGEVLGPDGNSICEPGGPFPEGSTFRIFVIDPDGGPGGGTVLTTDFVCGVGEYSAEVHPGTYHLVVSLPNDPDHVGSLPWRYQEPTPVTVEFESVIRDIQIFDGLPMGGSATLDGIPIEGMELNLLFSPLSHYYSGIGTSGLDGSWEDRIPGRTMTVQPGVDHLVGGTPCFWLGTRVVAGVPEEPFSFPTEVAALNCELERSPAVDLTHDATRLVVTPMPGDVGGLSAVRGPASELDEEWGHGWGVQFPVPEGGSPQHGPYSQSQLYKGGLMVGINPGVILSGVDVGGHLQCGAACRDFGLDGTVKTKGSEVVWSYTDQMSPEGVGLAVEQHSFDGQDGSDYVLFQFAFTNNGSSTLTFYPGFFGDWDVDGQDGDPGYYYDDVGATDLGGRLMYLTNDGGMGTHIGTAWLGDGLNPVGHFMTSGGGPHTLSGQFEALSGAGFTDQLGPADLYSIHAAGAVTLLPGQSANRWMAVVAGDDKGQLLANAAAAEADVAERSRKDGALQITITDLGILPGGDHSLAWRVNDKGQAVGYSRTTGDGSAWHPFIWTDDDGMVDQLPYPGHDIGRAYAINEKGEIAGAGRVAPEDPDQAWIQDKKGRKTLLQMPPDWSFSLARGINEKGEVAGYGQSDTYRAFFWSAKDGMMDLGFLPGTDNAYATDINKKGEVVGSSWTYDDLALERAYLWTEKDGMVSLGDLNGGPTDARALNDKGDVVGMSYQTPRRAFLWTEEDGMMDLGTLPGHNAAWALDINEDREIVGSSFVQEDGSTARAFLWTWEHGMENLPTLPGGGFSEAQGINNQGQIVGRARDDLGLMHAVMWTVTEIKK